jgi:ribosomal protein L11 methyltransferase
MGRVAEWLELSITVPSELVEPLTELFTRYGRSHIAIEESGGFNPDEGEKPPEDTMVTIRTYIPHTVAGRQRKARIEVGLSLLRLIEPLPELKVRLLPTGEWEQTWRAHFTLLKLGRRLVVTPSWIRYNARPEEIVVTMDPGLAFGTGHHPTTRLCLEVLDELVHPGTKVLDVGTGSGILAIAAASLGATQVLALDTDPVAIRMARRNIRTNDMGRRIRVRRGSLPQIGAAGFGVIVTNISALTICKLASSLRDALDPGGILITSGILQKRRDVVLECLYKSSLTVSEERRDGDWLALVCSR